MSSSHSLTASRLSRLAGAAAPLVNGAPAPLAGVRRGKIVSLVMETICLWRERSIQRRQLAALGEPQLRDIGVTRSEASAEVNKPFWMA